jgi:pilus assembly protein CpaE
VRSRGSACTRRTPHRRPPTGPLETPDRIDELFIERSAQVVTDRLHVLSSEENLVEQLKYDPSAAGRLIDTLRHRYNFVVIDAPFTGMPIHRDLLMLGHQRVLVMDPTLAAVRDMLRLLALPNGPLHVHRAVVVMVPTYRSVSSPATESILPGLSSSAR